MDFTSEADASSKGSALVDVLACVLARLVAANDHKLVGRRTTMTKFHALRPPEISVHAYLQRILKFAACSPECFVLALVYIDRLIRGNKFVLSSLNVHRVIITSVMLAAKFFDDQYFKNRYYAQVGGIPCAEINSLELEFLFSINFSLHVKPDDFAKYELELRKHVISSVGCTCGRLAPHVDALFTMSVPSPRRQHRGDHASAGAAPPVPVPGPAHAGHPAPPAVPPAAPAAAAAAVAGAGTGAGPEEPEDVGADKDADMDMSAATDTPNSGMRVSSTGAAAPPRVVAQPPSQHASYGQAHAPVYA